MYESSYINYMEAKQGTTNNLQKKGTSFIIGFVDAPCFGKLWAESFFHLDSFPLVLLHGTPLI